MAVPRRQLSGPGMTVGLEWPLVGRADEVRLLRALAMRRERSGVLLAGPAGVGKTRLATELLGWAEQAGFATARVTATRAASRLPFGALAPLLPETPVRTEEGDGRPAFALAAEPHSAAHWAGVLRRAAEALVERAAGRPFVLMVDDVNLLDDASATLVQQVVTTTGAFLLATWRTGEAAPTDPVTALWKEGHIERLELAGLGADAVGEVLAAALGGPVDPAAVAHLAGRSCGNMLFLRELVLGALQDRTLRTEGGIWRLSGHSSPSERLVEIVEVRLGGLGPAERDLLEIVSYGEPLGTAELHAAGDPVLAEDLERTSLLVSRRDGRRLELRLAHPIYGEVLRARIPALRARAIARALAEAVERTGARRREDILRVATWRLESGGADPEVMLAAAALARWRYDFGLAERLAQAAIGAGAGFEAKLLAASLAGLQGRTLEMEAELGRLAADAQDDTQRGRIAMARIDNYVFYTGRVEEGLRIAQEAEAAIRDPAWRGEIAARRIGLLIGAYGPAAAVEAAPGVLSETTGSALIMAGYLSAYAFGRAGQTDAALAAALKPIEAQRESPEAMDWYLWVHHFFVCEALAYGGRIVEAEALAHQQYEQALLDGSAEEQAWFNFALAKIVGVRGDVGAAVRHGREGAVLFKELDRPLWQHYCLAYLALALALGGRPAEAAGALAELDDLGLPPTYFIATDLLEARAWTAVAEGDIRRAHGLLEEAATLGEQIGDRVGESAALHGLARLGRAKAVVGRLNVLTGLVQGELIPARFSHAAALAEGDASPLEAVSSTFEAMGADLLAAEAAADAAAAWRRAGHQRHAAAQERRAGILADRRGGFTTPSLQSRTLRTTLTRAEREVAMRAAAGRSNKEIAAEFRTSVRTVANQLQRVYSKLGITGRGELGGVLSGDPPGS